MSVKRKQQKARSDETDSSHSLPLFAGSSVDENIFLRNIVDVAPVGVVVVDPEGQIKLINQAVLKLFKYEQEELVGQSIELLIPQRYRVRHPGLMRSYFANPAARPMGAGRDLFAARSDGSEFPIEIGLTPLDTDGSQYVLATIVDISQRKHTERLLGQNRDLFNAVVEAAPTGIVMVDHHGRITLVNCLIENLFGYSRDEMIGRPIEMLMPARIRVAHPELVRSFFTNPSARPMGSGRDLFAARQNGTEFPVEIGLSPVSLPEGHQVLATIVDITERKNEELKLRRANESLEEFVYVASHDLRSPLRGISDLLEWIAEDLDETPNAKIAQNVDRAKIRVERLERLIADLLAYARAGLVDSEKVLFDVRTMIEKVLELQPIRAGFKIELDVPELLQLHADKTAIETVLRNLIANAVKHHDRDDGIITVTVRSKAEFMEFAVRDDGPGIPSQAQARIFKLFQTATNKDQKSSGVGLAISKRMVEAHGGWIVVESLDGQRGTTFRFFWPDLSVTKSLTSRSIS